MQRLQDGRLGDAVHAGDVDVADGCARGAGVEVVGEVEREQGGGSGEEDVAEEREVPGDGDDDGGERDVRDALGASNLTTGGFGLEARRVGLL